MYKRLRWSEGPKIEYVKSDNKAEDEENWYRHYNSYEYEIECNKCGEHHVFQTQDDNYMKFHPDQEEDRCCEYVLDFYLRCRCGEFLKLDLPVG